MNIDIAGKLFPNIATVITQLLATGVLLYFFKKFLWKPLQDYMAKRADFIEGNIQEAKTMKEEAKVFLKESEEQSRESAKEYRDIIERAKQDALKVKEGILEEAREEATSKIEQAQKEIAHQKALAQEEMKQEIVEIALEAASKVIEKDMSQSSNQTFVEKFVKEMKA